MKKIFAKKSRTICCFWLLFGIVILGLIQVYEGTSRQELIGNIVRCYMFGSCIVPGVAAYIAKKEKKK